MTLLSLSNRLHAGVQVRHHHHVATQVEMGGEADVVIEAQVLAVEREILQSGVRPIGHDQRRRAAGAVVEPQAMRRLHIAGITPEPPHVRTHLASLSY